MHELSIVQDLFKICETNAIHHSSKQIRKVEVQVGRLSGVEPYYLQSAFDAFKVGTICADAEILIQIQDIMVNCSSCGFDGYIDADEFLCPNCKSKNLTITAGEDILLMRLELE